MKKVTNIIFNAEDMEQSTIYKDMLSEVNKVLKTFLTFSVTNATAECVILWRNRARCTLNKEILDLLIEERVSGACSGRSSL